MTFTKKNPSRHIVQTGLIALSGFAGAAQALSLDEAINQQLEAPPGNVVCGRLFDAGAELTGALLDICSRAFPLGATANSSGGNSATPASLPVADIGVIEEAKRKNDQSVDYKISSNWGLFLTLENEALDKKQTENEAAFDSNLDRLIVGAAYIPQSAWSFITALNISNQDADFANGGNFTEDGAGLRAVATYNPSDRISLQFAGAYDRISADKVRATHFTDIFNDAPIYTVSATPESAYDYERFGLTLRANYDFNFGGFNLTPQFSIDWLDTNYETYSETGVSGLELTFHDDQNTSFQTSLGLMGTYAISTDYGVIVPHFNVAFRHEFEDKGRDINVSFVDDLKATRFTFQAEDPDADFVEASIGSVMVFANGVQGFINIQKLLAHEFYDSLTVSAGVRLELLKLHLNRIIWRILESAKLYP